VAYTKFIRREFPAYFLSPIAYVAIAVFLAVTGHRFYLTMEHSRGPRFTQCSSGGDLLFGSCSSCPTAHYAVFAEERNWARSKCCSPLPA
jgi:hypothetical protein